MLTDFNKVLQKNSECSDDEKSFMVFSRKQLRLNVERTEICKMSEISVYVIGNYGKIS